MKNKWIAQIFGTKLGWLGISIFFIIVFAILSNFWEWALLACMLSCVIPAGLWLVGTIYAWIINPLKNLFK